MGKNHEAAREMRKKPQRTLKEKRAAKQIKKMSASGHGEVHVE